MNSVTRSTTSEGGFSILSVLVAVLLLSIGVVAVSSTGVYVLAVQTDASMQSTATSIAVSYMEEVKKRQPATLASEGAVIVNEVGEEDTSGRFTRILSVTDEPSVEDSKRVTVEVWYPAGRGRSGTVELVTVIYQGNQ